MTKAIEVLQYARRQGADCDAAYNWLRMASEEAGGDASCDAASEVMEMGGELTSDIFVAACEAARTAQPRN